MPSSSDPTDSDSTDSASFGPESRLLDRVRNWVDVFPWLRLVRVCRVAGGPVWLAHTLLIALIWTLGLNVLTGQGWTPLPARPVGVINGLPIATSTAPSDFLVALPGLPYADRPAAASPSAATHGTLIVWTILLWLPTTMALLRVGALLSAGRDMPSYLGTFRAVGRRLPGALLIVVLPSLMASLFWLISAGLTGSVQWVSGSQDGTGWLAWAVLPIALPSTLLAAILVLGGRAAVPLALTALVVEPDPDPIDSLSRGYEYTLRRLPQLALLVIVAALIASVILAGFMALAHVGEQLSGTYGAANMPLVNCLRLLPSTVAVMLLWSMLGGVYLLLRQSSGGQEVEDLTIEHEHWKSPKLPSVRSSAS